MNEELAVALDVLQDGGSPSALAWACAVAEAWSVLPDRRISLRERISILSVSGYTHGSLGKSSSGAAMWTHGYSTAGSWSARERGRHSLSTTSMGYRDRSYSGHAQRFNILGYEIWETA